MVIGPSDGPKKVRIKFPNQYDNKLQIHYKKG